MEGNNNKFWDRSENFIKNVTINIVGESKGSMLQDNDRWWWDDKDRT